MTDLGEAATTVPPGDAAMFPGTEDGAQRRGLFGLAPGSLQWEPQNHRGLARRFITPVARLRRRPGSAWLWRWCIEGSRS